MDKAIEQTVKESFDQAYDQGVNHCIEIIKQFYPITNNGLLLGSIIKQIQCLRSFDKMIDTTIKESLKPITP